MKMQFALLRPLVLLLVPFGASGCVDLTNGGGDGGLAPPPDLVTAADFLVPADQSMAPMPCTDGKRDGDETDVDCGGATCSRCANGKACLVDSDCTSANCQGHTCSACIDSLANVALGDFRVRFTLTTRAAALSTVIYQRSICNTSNFWQVLLEPSGVLEGSTDDLAGHLSRVNSGGVTVNDGNPHTIVFGRISQVMYLEVDGAKAGSAPSTASLGMLAPLGEQKGHPCENVDGTAPLVGTVTNVCLSI
jgi:hypothetical protein